MHAIKNQQTVPTPEGCCAALVLGWLLDPFCPLAPCTLHLAQQNERAKAQGPFTPLFSCQTIHPNPNTTTVVAADTQTSPSQSRSELPALRLWTSLLSFVNCPSSPVSTSLDIKSRPTFKMREIVSCPRPQKNHAETRRPMLCSRILCP